VRSRNLKYEEAKARYRAVKIQLQWVVKAGKKILVWDMDKWRADVYKVMNIRFP
jgi:hypothetical protein